ncbi:MAG: glycogen/starch synthase, partial [Gemmatimonadales bacterium]
MSPLGAHVLHLTAEYWPYARTGGLGEAVRGLALYQARAGIPVVAVLPLYRAVRETGVELEPSGDAFDVPVGPRRERARIWKVAGQRANEPRILLVEHEEYFDRAGIYGEAGADYPDNGRRFGFLSAAVTQKLPQLVSGRPLIHAHDWHTALAPIYLRTVYRGRAQYDQAGCVMSVHNAGFQG